MTTNAFVFAWDQLGIESIIPITEFEKEEKDNLLKMLKEEKVDKNPLSGILTRLTMRAKLNTHRYYEIYAVDCDEGVNEGLWRVMWETNPQGTADLIREKGLKIYSDRAEKNRIKIT